MTRTTATTFAAAIALLFPACADSDTERTEPPAAADSVSPGVDRNAELTTAAERIIAFLRQESSFDDITIADTVALYMNPEGSIVQRTLTRDELRDPANWQLQWERMTYRIAPPRAPATVEMRVGRHFNCQEQDLSSRVPQLAGLPHIGVRINPPDADSCLQTWNSTFVFDANAAMPTLIAVVYDQWEW